MGFYRAELDRNKNLRYVFKGEYEFEDQTNFVMLYIKENRLGHPR